MVNLNKEFAKKELQKFNIRICPENINVVIKELKTPQFPPGFEEIVSNLQDHEKLKNAMRKFKIEHILHVEGPTLWDHTRLALLKTEKLNLDPKLKKDLKILIFFHDFGKTQVFYNKENYLQTQKNLKKGNFWQSMMKHEESGLEEIEEGLKANGISSQKIEKFIKVIKNHMRVSLLEEHPGKIVNLFETFGKNETEIKDFLETLALVFKIDNQATYHLKLNKNNLVFSIDKKRTQLTARKLFACYQKFLQIINKN